MVSEDSSQQCERRPKATSWDMSEEERSRRQCLWIPGWLVVHKRQEEKLSEEGPQQQRDLNFQEAANREGSG